ARVRPLAPTQEARRDAEHLRSRVLRRPGGVVLGGGGDEFAVGGTDAEGAAIEALLAAVRSDSRHHELVASTGFGPAIDLEADPVLDHPHPIPDLELRRLR